MSKETTTFFTPHVDLEKSQTLKILYLRKGVKVDLVEPINPIFLSDYSLTSAQLKPILLAVKHNEPGFWNQNTNKFEDQPLFPIDESQIRNPRHSLAVFENERNYLRMLKTLSHLSHYVPAVFESDPEFVITEFIEGELLEHLIEKDSFETDERQKVALQLMDFIYFLHTEACIHHNDFHDKSVIVKPDGNIVVFDFGMAGEKLTSQEEKWFDINQLNKTLVRLVTANLKERIQPLNQGEIKAFNEIGFLLEKLPFTEESLYETYREFLKKGSANLKET